MLTAPGSAARKKSLSGAVFKKSDAEFMRVSLSFRAEASGLFSAKRIFG